MLRLDTPRPADSHDGFSRRDFLHAGSLAPLGLTLPRHSAARAPAAASDVSCILLVLVGGPSQLDSWDPKPDAPAEVRGPFRPIATNVPGLCVSELFPRMAEHADKFSLVRSVYHTASAVHDSGHQLMQTGRSFRGGVEHPHVGCVLGYLRGGRGGLPAHVLLPGLIGNTGGNMPHGQSAGYLGRTHDPFVGDAWPEGPARAAFDLSAEPAAVRDRYGRTRFGRSCLLARRLIETGVRFVTVNQFETVFGEPTWDIHGSEPFTDFQRMAEQVAPDFDRAYAALLGDLHERGRLATTMVAGFGEFGRTPKINAAGGRDHHHGVWTVLLGGGPLRGGRVVGASDEWGYAVKSRPVTPGELTATIYKGLGLDPHQELPGPQGRPLPLVGPGVQPIGELF